MKYHVNDSCIGCGLCAGTCPEVFSMSDAGAAVAIETEVPGDVFRQKTTTGEGYSCKGISGKA